MRPMTRVIICLAVTSSVVIAAPNAGLDGGRCFDSIVEGSALRLLVSGMPFYRIEDR